MRLAYYDKLTGLPNKEKIRDRLQRDNQKDGGRRKYRIHPYKYR